MNDKIKKFAEMVSNDQNLKKKLECINANDPSIIEKIISIAKDEGFDLSKSDFDGESVELTNEEMKAITGAGGCGCSGFGHGGGDGLSCTCVVKGSGYVEGKTKISSQGGCFCFAVGAGATRRH